MSSILSGVQEMSALQNSMQDSLLDLADVVTLAASADDTASGWTATGGLDDDGSTEYAAISLTGNEFGAGQEGLNAGDALLLEYDKNFISTQSEIANVMGKALTEVQSNINTKLQYLAR